ncbi:MAG: HypC/HybG/HupF family hydrogenase formation chaperone [SAR324 cluster bacterium]|uniref:HypC/HybG/HupF family hydrogenase formation chaperone n=1 Tax=SAR324 cluster bacterium TaxID=2024889 RepID=A0A7X9FTB0_9DELT|nr:HypC/HybG/HupF family hydrogenase formation chaperone [SAR324 cluster bacterium]
MCLAVPMQLKSIDKHTRKGVAHLAGVKYDVDLSLLEDVKEGGYIIVHAGFAIEQLNEKEAEERIALFKELALHNDKKA